MKLEISWTDDCQGKKDYDGSIVAISTRYWPGNATVFDSSHPELGLHETPMGKPSALSSIALSDGYPNHNGNTKSLISKKFEGETFAAVAAQVEAWAQEQMDRVESALLAEFNQ
jgi:hypothetical protein